MKLITCLLVTVFVLAACVPTAASPTSVATVLPSATSTITPVPTSTVTLVPTVTATPVLTELQVTTRIFPTATVTPMTVVPVSAGPLTLTEFNAGTEMKRLNVIGTGTPHDIEFSPDGKLFAVATERGVYLYDGITFEQKSFLDLNETVDAIAFSPEGDTLAVAVNGKVGLWSVFSGQKLLQFEGEVFSVSSLAYGQGDHVAAVSWGEMGLWDARTGHQIYEEENFENGYGTRAVTFTADGKQLVFGGKRGITTVESGYRQAG